MYIPRKLIDLGNNLQNYKAIYFSVFTLEPNSGSGVTGQLIDLRKSENILLLNIENLNNFLKGWVWAYLEPNSGSGLAGQLIYLRKSDMIFLVKT